jgi:hypothetical protein
MAGKVIILLPNGQFVSSIEIESRARFTDKKSPAFAEL